MVRFYRLLKAVARVESASDMNSRSAALLIALAALPLHAQQPGDSSRVSINGVWTSLPDFVCKERIVSRTLNKGNKAKEQRVIESIFTAQRKEQVRPDGTKVYSVVESREPITIDGKRAAGTAQIPASPLFFDGLAANILFIADVPRYQASSAGILDGRLSMRIGFTTKNSREFLQMEFPAAVSNVQIASQSSKTLHVENRLGSLHGGSGIPVSADFQSLDIDGNQYWVPRFVKADSLTAKNETLSYTAEYTDCKKFNVKVEIHPLPVQ
jgi:hypothetical protein